MTKAKFGSLLLLFQGILLILFVVFVDYGDEFFSSTKKTSKNALHGKQISAFQDLHVMTFLGFGLIMTFLRRYSRGMLVHAFLIGGLVIQWATLLQGFFNMNHTKVEMSLDRMIKADYAVVAILISFGAVMGKCNSLQLLIAALFETFFFAVNEGVATGYFKISDHGRSILVHVFGAYFGLALSRMIYSRKVCMSQALSMSNKSEMYSFIGTLFLWIYWPSINSSFVDGAAKHRAIANTYYALAASCISAFSFTVLQSKESRFNVLHLQNATIAGGVAVGAVASMVLRPWGAVIVGIVGALSSVLGYKYAVPKLRRSLKVHDTRGIQAAHGIPGIVSGISSVIAAVLASESLYGSSLYEIYPARTPKINTTQFIELQQIAPFKPGLNRSAMMQGVYQLAGLAITIIVALLGGLATGLVIKIKFFEPVTVNDAFDDHIDFEEENCIDVSSEPEYDEDDEKHHDSVHGKTRLVDDHHSDIVAGDDRSYAHLTGYGSKNGSVAHSIDRSNHSINKINESNRNVSESPVPAITIEEAANINDAEHSSNDMFENGIELQDTSTQPLITISNEHDATEKV